MRVLWFLAVSQFSLTEQRSSSWWMFPNFDRKSPGKQENGNLYGNENDQNSMERQSFQSIASKNDWMGTSNEDDLRELEELVESEEVLDFLQNLQHDERDSASRKMKKSPNAGEDGEGSGDQIDASDEDLVNSDTKKRNRNLNNQSPVENRQDLISNREGSGIEGSGDKNDGLDWPLENSGSKSDKKPDPKFFIRVYEESSKNQENGENEGSGDTGLIDGELVTTTKNRDESNTKWFQRNFNIEPTELGSEEGTNEDFSFTDNVLNTSNTTQKDASNGCSYQSDSFKLRVDTASLAAELESDFTVNCYLNDVRLDKTTQPPLMQVAWMFQEGKDEQGTASILLFQEESLHSWNETYTMNFTVSKAQYNHSGTYACMVGLREDCLMSTAYHNQTKSVNIKVYQKSYYGANIGIILGTCFLLLLILIGLFSYTRKVRAKSKNRYNAMLASTKIQCEPTKILDLPHETVFRTTTTEIGSSKRSSCLSSKSSFSVNQDD